MILDGMKFYEVKIFYLMENDETGKLKKITEKYLIEASSCTEAEKITKEKIEFNGMDGFKILSITESKILAVIRQSELV